MGIKNWNAGIIRPVPVAPAGPYETSAAPGIWTLDQVAYWQKQGLWPIAGNAIPIDPYFNQTTLLLHGDGTNGAQNNTFLDSSTNNFAITRNGNTTQGTFTPFSQAAGYWANYFDGTGDYLDLGNQTALKLTSEDFTVEFWVFPTTTGFGQVCGPWRSGDPFAIRLWGVFVGSNLAYFSYTTSTSYEPANDGIVTGAAPVGQWTHIAIVRQGTSIKCYSNGVLATSSNAMGTIYPQPANNSFWIGANRDNQNFIGDVSNLRLVKGTAVYTANFTPSTTPLIAITNTSLLTCQSNRFVDNSTNNFTLTANGNVAVQPFSPFQPTAAYSPTVNGGSGYFDGTGDYLSLASNAAFTVGTGDVTIEAWVYITSFGSSGTAGYNGIISGRIQIGATGYPGLGLVIDNYKFTFTISNYLNALTDTVNAPTNQWVHVVGVRSGTNAALFINGVRKASSTNSENNTSSAMVIGRYYPADDDYYFNGYISNARLVKGTAVYDPTQTTITVPTAPVIAITNTSLLTNFTNAGIFDNAMKNDLETVGNAQISTAVVKYGTGSMKFDGAGDALFVPQSTGGLLDIRSMNATIEGWVYLNDAATSQAIIGDWTTGASPGPSSWILGVISNTIYGYVTRPGVAYYDAGMGLTFSTAIAAGAWYHFALVGTPTTATFYLNGTLVATSAYGIGGSLTKLSIGATSVGTASLNGYIDDLRITKGVARYTANFTPPTAAFPNQ